MMGGFPSMERRGASRGLRGRRRRPRRARRFPSATRWRRTVIHAAGTAALRPGDDHAVLAVGGALASASGRGHGLREPRAARGLERFADDLATARTLRLIVPTFPSRSPAGARGVRRGRRRARAAGGADDADEHWRASAPAPAVSLRRLGRRHDRRARRLSEAFARSCARQGRDRGAGRGRVRHQDPRAGAGGR